jgi:hypothetical protein
MLPQLALHCTFLWPAADPDCVWPEAVTDMRALFEKQNTKLHSGTEVNINFEQEKKSQV